jgi:hypothetical protein
MEQASIGWSLVAQTFNMTPSTTTLGAPAGKFAMVCPLWTDSVAFIEPCLGTTEFRFKGPEISPAWPRAKKRRAAIAKLLVSTPSCRTRRTRERGPAPPTAHRRSLFVRHCMGKMQRTVLVPSFGKMSCSLSAKLGFSRCQPAAFPLPGPSSSVWTLACGTWEMVAFACLTGCKLPTGNMFVPRISIVYPPPADRGSSTHAALAWLSGQVSGVQVGPRYMPILCVVEKRIKCLKEADSSESSLGLDQEDAEAVWCHDSRVYAGLSVSMLVNRRWPAWRGRECVPTWHMARAGRTEVRRRW